MKVIKTWPSECVTAFIGTSNATMRSGHTCGRESLSRQGGARSLTLSRRVPCEESHFAASIEGLPVLSPVTA